MKNKNIITIASVALGTASLTVLAFWSASLEAGNEPDASRAEIAKPKLVCHGIEMTLTPAGGGSFKAGDEPVFELRAVNTTGESAAVAVRLALTASSAADALSRVLPIPAMLWQQEQTLALKPNETKTVTVSSRTKLPANRLFFVSLQDPDAPENGAATVRPEVREGARPAAAPQSSIVAMTFSTLDPAAHLASTR